MRRHGLIVLAAVLCWGAPASGQTPDIWEGHVGGPPTLEQVVAQLCLQAWLEETVNVKGLRGKHTLQDLLEFVTEKHDLPLLLVDVALFEQHEMKDILEKRVRLARTKGVSKGELLGQILQQAGAWYEIEPGHIRIIPLQVWIANRLQL